MNTSELLNELQKLGIPSSWYLVGDKGITDDKIVLRLTDNQWSVYYSDRGGKYKLKTFETEEEACNEVLLRIKFKKDRQEKIKEEAMKVKE